MQFIGYDVQTYKENASEFCKYTLGPISPSVVELGYPRSDLLSSLPDPSIIHQLPQAISVNILSVMSTSIASIANKLHSADYLAHSEESQKLSSNNCSICQLTTVEVS